MCLWHIRKDSKRLCVTGSSCHLSWLAADVPTLCRSRRIKQLSQRQLSLGGILRRACLADEATDEDVMRRALLHEALASMHMAESLLFTAMHRKLGVQKVGGIMEKMDRLGVVEQGIDSVAIDVTGKLLDDHVLSLTQSWSR